MKMTGSLMIISCAALLCGCAGNVPSELVNARAAYQQASAGPAAQLAQADLHKAHDALARAERSFEDSGESYQTRDLAYVAQRKAEMAAAQGSIASEQKTQARAANEYQATQGEILDEKTQDLSDTRTALAASQQAGEATARKLSAEQRSRRDAEYAKSEQTAVAQQATQELNDARIALAVSAQSGKTTAAQLSTEQQARLEAEKKTAAAQAALAKLAAVHEDERGMIITLSGSVLFRSGDATLMSGAQSRLDQIADALLANPDRNIVVEGYTDSQGSDAYNLTLSQRRADAVRDYLVHRGYPAARLQSHGIGEGRPIANNTTSEGRANNRRVELVLEREARP